MNDELMKYLLVGGLILFAFIPLTLNVLRSRRVQPPPMAANDRKIYRMWRSDPDAYQRQYGDMDKQYLKEKGRLSDKEK
jgi:hypothetical protein